MSRSTTAQLEDTLTDLWNRERAYETALNNYADAHYAYKISYAKAFREAEGTVSARELAALESCSNQYKRDLQTEAVAAFTKEALRDAQMALTARQSLLKADRETEFGAINSRHSA